LARTRTTQAESLLQCFQELVSGDGIYSPHNSSEFYGGAGLHFNVSSSSSGSSSLTYSVPPSEFLKVLLEGNLTRLRSFHAALQAMGRGNLRGRAASLCLSELRMCMVAGTAPPGSQSSSTASNSQLPPLRLHQLREIADVCLSFIFDPDLTSTTATDGHQRRRRATGCSYYGEHTAADRNNGRVMMLDALPAVLGACCAAAAAEEHGFYSNSSDSENESDEDEDDMAADTMARAVDSPAEDFGPAAACSGRTNDNSRKGKGKKNPTRSDHHSVIGGRGKGGHRVTRQHQGQRHRNGDVSVAAGVGRRRVRATAGGQGRGDNFLPKRGAEVVVEITNALLDKPWGPQSALPLLRMFGEISDLVEALDKSCADHDGHRWIEDGASAHGRKTGVWTGVRSRLLECVWTGGLDGADFTGVLQQVCMLCEADIRRNFEQKDCRPRCYLRQDKNGVISCSDDATIRTVATAEGACVGKRGNNKDRQQSRETTRPQGIGDNNCSSGDIDGDWLSCLRWLYAAVPPDSLSTVELVLEQTLHQMPDVAESLLDSILRQRVVGDGGGGAGKRSSRDTELTRSNVTVPRTTGAYSAHDSNSSTHDLALLLLLLREAAPLRACSLPLLPDGADRGRRAEDGVRFLLLSAARRDPEYSWCDDNSNGSCRRNSGGVVREGRAGARASVRAMVKGVLWREAGWVGGGAGSTGGAVGGRGGDVGDGCEDEVESSSVASERASQLLELALRWLEECDEVRDGSGGGVDCIIGMDELAADTICTVFDAVPGARPRLLRSLLSGVVDRSQGGAVCAESYLFAWETVMAQEGRLHCRRLAPHSQVVSDVLGRLTLLPRDRARRVLQSMLPLADACRSHASALISLHRKCATQTGSKGRRLALHGVSCILVWNARRGTAAGVARDGCLNEDGVQEDLIAMFRRAMEGGLQTAARAEALHFLASNLFARPSFARTATSGNLTVTHPVSLAGAATGVPARGIGMAATAAATVAGVNVRILSGLRQILADRLSRFLVHKDDILACDGALDGGNGSSTGERHGYSRKYGAGDDAGYLSVVDRGKSKGKKRARASRGGRYQFAPMSLLEHRQHSSTYSIDRGGNGAAGGGGRVLFNGGGNSGIITRDAIGQLLRCCWALIPSGDDARSSGIPLQPVSEQRAEAEVVARAMLGSGSLSWLERGGREQATGGNGASTRSFTGGEVKAGSLEGEALLAVVEFLASGGIME
ncbi:unnamed protein product, partial [Sphacelaria rigidula]